jgi:hypothetical protein
LLKKAHVSPKKQVHRRDAKAAKRGFFSGESVRGRFSRSSKPATIDMSKRLRTFDLVASHHQIKKSFLFAISLPAGRQARLCGENRILDKSNVD